MLGRARRSLQLRAWLGAFALAACGDDGTAAGGEQSGAGSGAIAGGPASVADAAQAEPIDNIASIAGDHLDFCAVTGDGAAWCWGDNTEGQLGDGTSRLREGAVRVTGLNDVTQVTVGRGFACALRRSKEVVCWGRGGARALGVPSLDRSNVPVTVQDVRGATAISARGGHSCALLEDGSVKCWGELEKDGPIAIAGIANARAIAVGGQHACALLADGRLRCWGAEIGLDIDGADYRRSVPISDLDGVKAVFAGERATCVQLTGSVRCWGENANGELGDGTTNAARRPVAMSGITEVTSLAFGATHVCAVMPNGGVRCSGRSHIPGGATQDDYTTPTAVRGLDAALDVAAGTTSTCVLNTAGTVACWAITGGDPATVTASLGP